MNKFFDEWTNILIENLQNTEPFNIISQLENETFESKFKDDSKLNQIITNHIKSKFPQDSRIQQSLIDFISFYFKFKILAFSKKISESFESLQKSFNYFCDFFLDYKNYDLSPLLKYFIRNLFQTAINGDKELKKTKQIQKCVSECGRTLSSFFSKFQNEDDKLTVLYCVVVLIKIYFKLKTYRNSTPLIDWFEKAKFKNNELPNSQLSSILYYEGRLCLYELDIIKAQQLLTTAFELCINGDTPNSKYNSKLIFEYLIPINLFSGVYPKEEYLQKLSLDKGYKIIVDSVKNGDLLNFDKAIEKMEDRLIELGTFLIIGKLKPYVLRNVIYLIYKIEEKEIKQMKTPIIRLESILKVINNVYNYSDINLEELELDILGVIYRGLIGGYVHNGNKVLVLGEKNPFPKERELIKNNYEKII